MTGRLSPSLSLAPQEPAFSFLSRLAALHDVGAADFAEDMGLGFANVVAGRPKALRALADLAGVSQEDLEAWTPAYVGSRALLFRGEKFHARGLHSTSVSGCPACLRLDATATGGTDIGAMTIKAPWLVRHVTLCLVHQVPLVELWKVQVPNDRHDTTARLREIATNLFSGQMDEKARPPSEFDRWIWARLTGQKGNLWLDQFALYPAAHFCELLGRAAYATRIPKWKKFGPQDLHWSTRAGFQIASQGEKQIRSALTELQEKIGKAEDGPKKKFGDLYDRLAHDLIGEEYAPFRELLRDHIATTWALGPGDTLMGEPVLVRHKHSVSTAARETGTDPRLMRKLLIERGVLKEAGSRSHDIWQVFDAQATAGFLTQLNQHVSALELQEALSLNRSLFDGLRQDGYLMPALNGPDHKPLWDRSAALKFLERLMNGAEPIYVPMHDWCGLAKAGQRLKIRPGKILRMIEDGNLRRVGKYQGKHGFDAILIPLKDAERALQRPEAIGQSIELFAKTAGLSPAAAMALVRGGHIPTTAGFNPKTKAPQRFLCAGDLEAYDTRFVTLRRLAKLLGKSWQQLNADLTTAKITPFSPSGVDLGAIYEWQALESVGISRPGK